MNRLTFLKSLAALALAPAALLRVLAREPASSLKRRRYWADERRPVAQAHVDGADKIRIGDYLEKVDGKWSRQYKNQPVAIALEDSQPNGTVWAKMIDYDYTGYPAPENHFRVYDAKVQGGGE